MVRTTSDDSLRNAAIGYIKDQHNFIQTFNVWWNPQTTDILCSRWEDIHKAILLASNPAIIENPYWLCALYNVIIHPLYLRERYSDLRQLTNHMNLFLENWVNEGNVTHGFMIDSLIHTVGSHCRPNLLEGIPKQSQRGLENLSEIGKESILKGTSPNIKGTFYARKAAGKFLSFLELEKSVTYLRQGGIQDAINGLWEAMKYAKQIRWFPVIRAMEIFLCSAYRLIKKPDYAKELLRSYLNDKRGFQPRREIQALLEHSKLSNDYKVKLNDIQKAERVCERHGLRDRVLLVNILNEKRIVFEKLGKRKLAEEAFVRANILGTTELDEQKLLVY